MIIKVLYLYYLKIRNNFNIHQKENMQIAVYLYRGTLFSNEANELEINTWA